MKTLKLIIASILAGIVLSASAAAPIAESPKARDARMEWFREARFGMFIHWGLYSVLAGEYQGKPVGGIGEWIQETAKIPVSEYEKLAPQFNPVRYNAREWVANAKIAGMKYIVITSKHHDGFGLWRSSLTDWCMKSTPSQRDLLKELADACQQEGIRLCFYHSIMDWHHPDWGTRRAWHDKATGTPDMDRYVAYMKGQLKELLTGYGPIGIAWFDGEWESAWTHERGVDLYNYVRSLQPNIIINNRVGKGRSGMSGMDKGAQRVGDYGTPEQEIPPTGFGPGVDWESCMTMNDTWGFKKNDQNWKSTETLVRNLIDCASKGGNYLLNIGPTAEGQFPEASVQRLLEMGNWMNINSESIYGTQASPFDSTPWGRCTQKALSGGITRLYLHVYNWPKDGKLTLNGLANQPVKAALLGANAALKVDAGKTSLTIALPAEAPNRIASVVALDIKGKPEIVKPDPYADETPEERAARMKWWHEARFGMFIHWGVYSVPAGTYKGNQIPGIGEWIMNRAKIPVSEYRDYAKQFNPVKYNAEEWVKLAKEAGMKYIVITSKHHDGFALFNSQASDWNIAKATPYGKDLLKPLAEACRKHGIRLGFYYSQAQDWVNGGSAAGGKWDKAQERDMTDYIRNIAAPQVREILSNYGKISVLWWDTPTDMNQERAEMLIPLLKLQPGIIHNNRLGGGYRGDTETPEQFIPATGYPGRDWETCMTMNDTWGFKSYDNNWKSTEKMVRNLVDIASKGGNYLLNVGPTSEGLIPGPSVERLKEVGKWMKVNGDAIYATTASPFKRLPWGRCTTKAGKDSTTLFLHVFDWPADGKLVVPGLMNTPRKAWLLADRKEKSLTVAAGTEGLTITLPSAAPDPISSTVVLTVRGAPQVEQITIVQDFDGSLVLAANEATLRGKTIRYEEGSERNSLGFWTDPADFATWDAKIQKPGKFEVTVEAAATGKSALTFAVGDKSVQGPIQSTGDYGKFRNIKLGTIEIGTAGKAAFSLKAVKEDWQPVNVRSVRLRPVAN